MEKINEIGYISGKEFLIKSLKKEDRLFPELEKLINKIDNKKIRKLEQQLKKCFDEDPITYFTLLGTIKEKYESLLRKYYK